ncbi:MAG TPA: DUF3817 domain-containing protein, partial [Luteimonas sp.]|nr:DUF3817 domain-containing protein [Luteimonas sp.]
MPAAPIGRLFSTVALIEAATWTGLLAGMYFKYGTGLGDLGVRVFGPLHGLAFLVYLGVALFAAHRLRWPLWLALLAILAAVPPLATLPLEAWLRSS